MKKLTILIDMDDTIENFCETWVAFLNEKHIRNVRHADIVDWELYEFYPGLSHEEIYAPLNTVEFWKRVKPFPGAVYYIQKMIEDGHRVVVVTASGVNTIALKMNLMLFKYFPFLSFNDVIIASQKDLIKGDLLIDDAIHNFERWDGAGIMMNAPHNQKYDAEAHGLKRANNWIEIYQIVQEFCTEGEDTND